MRSGAVLRPKEPRNFGVTIVLAVLMVIAYAIGSFLRPWSPKSGLGLIFGFVAAFLFLFEMAYPWRRSRARPLRTAKNWVQAHIYLGVLASLAVLVHSDFGWPHGSMGWALLVLSFWTTATGLAGVFLQKWIPVALTEGLRVEALYERIPELVKGLVTEADALMQGTSDVLSRFYRTEVRKLIATPNPSWSFILDVRGGRDRALEPFRRISQYVEASEKQKMDDLMAIYIEKVELDAHYSLQGLLRRWLVWHVPPAAVLIALVVVHVFGWVWY